MFMKAFIVFLLLFLQVYTISLSAAAEPGDGQGTTVNGAASKKFKTTFVSLSPGHAIASSFFIFTDQDRFEIKTPGEDYQQTSGGYTRNNIVFEASFKATVLKQKKHYLYVFSAKGIFLLGDYIAGMVVLQESIQETMQNQKVTFLFTGTSEEVSAAGEEKKNIFPF
jgi:hypothetical protein